MTTQETSSSLKMRLVTIDDLPVVAEIYNYYVLHSTCTFATEPEGPEYWQHWFAAHDATHPAIVAEQDREIVGWGTLSTWNKRCAYRSSVEDSIYVRHEWHRRGIGKALLTDLITRGRQLQLRSIVAQISREQEPSEKLHTAAGFRLVGYLENIGRKFDRWIDVGIWQLQL